MTGASRGIGRGVAERLLASGWSVVGTYATSTEAAAALSERYPALHMVQVDFADREHVAAFVDGLSATPLQAIVNNAGIVELEPWEELSMATWDRVFDVNVRTPVLVCHALGRTLPNGGAIVNVASTDGYTGTFGSIAYAASKAALINVTKSLGNVLGPHGVRVNCVAPGWVSTEMATDASFAAAGLTPLGRNGTPGDIASVVEFLLSEEASFITGATFVVDGGYTNVDSIMKQEHDDLTAASAQFED